MADSKAKGPESEETSEALEQRNNLEGRNEISIKAQVSDHPQPLSDSRPGVPRNNNISEPTKVKSARLGTAPELAFGDLAHSKRACSIAPPTPFKLRFSVASSGNAASTRGGQQGSPLTFSSGQPIVRLRTKSVTPAGPPRPGSFSFRSCFGNSPTTAPSCGKSPSPQVPPRKQTSPSIRRITIDPGKPVVPPGQAEHNASALDPITNKPVAVAETSASATSKSPSCLCSIPTTEAENAAAKTEESVSSEPHQGASPAAGDSASIMNQAENDPGLTSGQQLVLNAETETLIAAVKLADDEESSRQPSPELSRPSAASDSRQSANGVSPIRGLRPSYSGESITSSGWRRKTDLADGDPSPRARKSPKQGRSRSPVPHNYDHFQPQATARGVERLFDAIVGHGDSFRSRTEQAFSQSPKRVTRKVGRAKTYRNYFRQQHASNVPPWPEQDDRQFYESPRGSEPAQNHLPAEPSSTSSDHLAYSAGQANPPQAASSSRGHTLPDPSDFPGTSMARDQEYPEQSGGREQVHESERFRDTRDEFCARKQLREARLLDSNVRWKKKDPLRESIARRKDPRRRGHPDPSFNPRPGDIIIRARKRAGLRLTDFYYYDNENYMEPGDQILRAKFDYLPPMDKMYLWCRLYVYSANNTYTFIDFTSESIGKYATAEHGVATLRKYRI